MPALLRAEGAHAALGEPPLPRLGRPRRRHCPVLLASVGGLYGVRVRVRVRARARARVRVRVRVRARVRVIGLGLGLGSGLGGRWPV